MPLDYVQHLMSFYDGRFGGCEKFVSYLFDQMQRHELCRVVASLGRKTPEMFEKIGHLINNAEFLKELEEARADPEGEEANALVKELTSILVLIGRSGFLQANVRPHGSRWRPCRYLREDRHSS